MFDTKKNSSFYLVVIVLFLLPGFFGIQLKSQSLLRNGSLNGSPQDQIPPYEWHAQECDTPNTFNTPNIYTTDSSHQLNSIIYPYVDSTFVALRARGKYYQSGYYPPETREFLVQTLTNPLGANSCYIFSAYLRTDLKMSVIDSLEPNKGYPPTLEIWGSDDICTVQDSQPLAVSKPVSNPDWQRYNIRFCTKDKSYSDIRLQISWDSSFDYGEPYNGILYMDSLNLVKACIPDTIYHSLVYKGDNKTTLTAVTAGISFGWNPNKNLSADTGRSVAMEWFDTLQNKLINYYYATVARQGQCPVIEKFKVKFYCDTLYPKKILDTLYYKYFHKVTLNTYPGGVKYIWEPITNLSDPTSCCPYLTGFDTSYSVTIIDRYNCRLYQYFQIKALCDSLVPEKNVLVMDTILDKNHPSIILKPKVGKVKDQYWNPLIGLSSIDGWQTAIASPISEQTYTVWVVDSFNCTHYERFHIGVEMFIPNFITPNGDKYNQCFKVFGLPDKTSLKIFDKSGALIFSVDNYDPSDDTKCWDGINNNKHPVETGTYWYVLSNPGTGLLKRGFVFVRR
jgi:gliding motility-associated-like protein